MSRCPSAPPGTFPGLTRQRVLTLLEGAFGPARPGAADGCGPAQYVTFHGFAGQVGFISALTHPFCPGCNRVRVTADGHLKTCLQFGGGVALKPLLEGGGGDAAVGAAIWEAIRRKPAGHHFAGPPRPGDEGRGMNQIGG